MLGTPPSVAELVADVRTLVETESPSDDRAALARSADVVAAMGERLLGAPPVRIETDGVPRLEWAFGGRGRVLLLGHHDTVWPIGSWDPVWATDGDRLLGPGVFDMKAGVVQILHAVAGLDDRDGVRILITGDEEVGARTSRDAIVALARECGVVLVTEASAPGGALKTERSGVAQYVVQVHGRAAHAGLEPENGVNATVELAARIGDLDALGRRTVDATVTPTLLSGGDTANTVPAVARVHVDVRARTRTAFEQVDTALTALAPTLPGARLDVARLFASPPLEEAASERLFALADEVATRNGGAPLERAAVGGASDGNIAAGAGALVLDGLGAVGGGAHARGEHALASMLAPRTLLLRGLVEAVLADRVQPVEVAS